MPTQIEKWIAHASHVLDAFVGLKARYAILDPLLFDQEVISRWGGRKRAEGFHYMRNALLYSCILDASNIALDGDRRTPSVRKLVEALDDSALVDTLREEYARWGLVASTSVEPDLLPLLEAAEEREENERRVQFDQHLAELQAHWAVFCQSSVLAAFVTMRDKAIAHREIQFVDGEYRALNTATLGIKFGDLKAVVVELEQLIDLVTILFRNASFDFRMLERQVGRYSEQFWAPLDAG